MKVIKINNIIKDEKKFFSLSKLDKEKIYKKINEIVILYKNTKYFIKNFEKEKMEIDKKLNEIKRKKLNHFYFLFYDKEIIGKIYINKKNFTVYLNNTFLEKYYGIKIENKKNIFEKINKERLLSSILNNNIEEYVYQCSKIIDVVLHTKKVNYFLYEDVKQDLIIKLLNFYNKRNNYKLEYNQDKIFNYIYKIVSNYYINIMKRKIYKPEIFSIY